MSSSHASPEEGLCLLATSYEIMRPACPCWGGPGGSMASPKAGKLHVPFSAGPFCERHSSVLSTISCLQPELKLLFVQQISALSTVLYCNVALQPSFFLSCFFPSLYEVETDEKQRRASIVLGLYRMCSKMRIFHAPFLRLPLLGS